MPTNSFKVGLPEHEVGKAALETNSISEVLGGGARRDEPSHHQRSHHGTPCVARSFVSFGLSRRRVNSCFLDTLRSEQNLCWVLVLLRCFLGTPVDKFLSCGDVSEVASVGPILERPRFRSTYAAVRARDHALSSLDVTPNEEDDDEDLPGLGQVVVLHGRTSE